METTIINNFNCCNGCKIKKKDFGLSDDDFYETMDIINNSTNIYQSTIDDFRNFLVMKKKLQTFITIPLEKVLYLMSSKLKIEILILLEMFKKFNIKFYK